MTPFARAAAIREPLLRWPCFASVWLLGAPEYFVGAALHGRLHRAGFWRFTWDVFCAAMRGAFVDYGP